MISWISGEIVEYWQTNQKYFVLINCQGLGYEIQILESFYLKLKTNKRSNTNVTLWIKHIKKEDTDLLFGFSSKEQKLFFVQILNIRGIGSQIGMGLLNKFSISEILMAINTQNKKLISSVPGIGQKMTERLFLELKTIFKNELKIEKEKKNNVFLINNENDKILCDLQLTLKSLNYSNKEIDSVLPNIINETKEIVSNNKEEKNISFEHLLKVAMNYLDNDSSNIGR
ncbi:Holliday junction DNA helicase RuvA [Prochlorococcus marinus str. MIT 9321]|uniref:Holliday junction branch migration complex subunit RuvA n=1 Tax=Prochlorococcus marinus str. MIT 9401 TaxID=167551 RepID=A0A0A2B1T2_PROMR|nr:Holliday junction branch migration protein RuvA [Prochlorococcus marinus]KGG04412.1 Holliday junction DNA helicase RuvA [Prochlorococcus marinus str. MIT 9322]KGG05134.1 Holliday junction DNA helicase RuvA [Prochlorococcus marinus str. MIT 9321]KGG07092.1 Holliday junction DNA helicase RuvA [Prochlorococcus marinus str. MIT 9401]